MRRLPLATPVLPVGACGGAAPDGPRWATRLVSAWHLDSVPEVEVGDATGSNTALGITGAAGIEAGQYGIAGAGLIGIQRNGFDVGLLQVRQLRS